MAAGGSGCIAGHSRIIRVLPLTVSRKCGDWPALHVRCAPLELVATSGRRRGHTFNSVVTEQAVWNPIHSPALDLSRTGLWGASGLNYPRHEPKFFFNFSDSTDCIDRVLLVPARRSRRLPARCAGLCRRVLEFHQVYYLRSDPDRL